MTSRFRIAFASASLLALGSATAVHAAQPAAPAAAAAPAENAELGEIVVTARRKSESLQEVPQTVNAVSSETLQKLNITQFTDVQTVVPGLSLSNSADGYNSSASMRGVTFDVSTAAPLPTVAMYINDAPVQSSELFNSLFDLGQIEVLRGPQGTTRGVSTPSGAMTVTTRRPDLSSYGASLNVTATDQQARNLQGAINIPIIKDILAIRAAGVIDQNDGNGVRSINNALRPTVTTSAERFSVSFEPSDKFDANLMYQHLDKRAQGFDQVSGPGVGFNGPAITPFDRASVEDGITDARTHQDIVTAQVDSRIFGQHLSYVGAYEHTKTHARNLGTGNNADVGDLIPGDELYNYENIGSESTSHEIRLASDPAPGRLLDYTVGAYYSWQRAFGQINAPGPFAQGAFGSPAGEPDLSAFNPGFVLANTFYQIPSTNQETSIFGNLTLHLGDKTELSGGIRHIWAVNTNNLTIYTSNGLAALPASLLGGVCSGASTYAGYCDTVIPSGGPPTSFPSRSSASHNIYNISLSHHFTRDFLVYGNTGTSFRSGFFSPGIQSQAILGSTDPLLASLSSHPAETSKSYEVGFKWTFLEGRGRLNFDVYRQKFNNFTIYIPNINYSNAGADTNFAFTQPVDALVKGFELDAAYQITRDWNVGLLASYSDGAVQGSQVVCNTFDANGKPTYNYQGVISTCPGGSASRLPYWNATLTSEYNHEVMENVDGFVRGLFTYYPKNENRMEPGLTVDNYGLLNLYAGLRSQDGAWEFSVFAKNALQNKTLLDKSPVAANLNGLIINQPFVGFPTSGAGSLPSSSGYYTTQVTPPREIGVNLRYAWGSR